MNLRTHPFRALATAAAVGCLVAGAVAAPAVAAPKDFQPTGLPQLEALER